MTTNAVGSFSCTSSDGVSSSRAGRLGASVILFVCSYIPLIYFINPFVCTIASHALFPSRGMWNFFNICRFTRCFCALFFLQYCFMTCVDILAIGLMVSSAAVYPYHFMTYHVIAALPVSRTMWSIVYSRSYFMHSGAFCLVAYHIAFEFVSS